MKTYLKEYIKKKNYHSESYLDYLELKIYEQCKITMDDG